LLEGRAYGARCEQQPLASLLLPSITETYRFCMILEDERVLLATTQHYLIYDLQSQEILRQGRIEFLIDKIELPGGRQICLWSEQMEWLVISYPE
jgi:hypothetical protein